MGGVQGMDSHEAKYVVQVKKKKRSGGGRNVYKKKRKINAMLSKKKR